MADLLSLPSKDILVECTEQIATTGEGARYLAESIETLFEKARVLDQFGGLVQKFHEHADTVVASERETSDIWGGLAPSTLFEKDAEHRAEIEAARVDPVPEEPAKILMDINVDKDAKIERGYLQDNEAPTEQSTAQLNSLFYAWLAKKRWVYDEEEGLCEAMDTGEIMLDESGAVMRVDPKRIEEELLKENAGLRAYVNSHAKGLEMEEENPHVAVSADEIHEGPT